MEPAQSALECAFQLAFPFYSFLLPFLPFYKCCYHTVKISQSCPSLYNPMDCNPPGSSVHGVLQARILEWVAMPSSRGSFPPRDGNHTLYVSWLVSSLLLVPTVLLALDIQTPLWVCIFALLLS